MKLHFTFNVPAEYLANGATGIYITIRAKRVFNVHLIEVHELPLYLLGAFKNPLQLMAAIETVVKEKFAVIDRKVEALKN